LPQKLLDANPERSYRIPMMGTGVRSLNLSNAVSIVLYEGLRQLGKLDKSISRFLPVIFKPRRPCPHNRQRANMNVDA
jgi:hypothetical protein